MFLSVNVCVNVCVNVRVPVSVCVNVCVCVCVRPKPREVDRRTGETLITVPAGNSITLTRQSSFSLLNCLSITPTPSRTTTATVTSADETSVNAASNVSFLQMPESLSSNGMEQQWLLYSPDNYRRHTNVTHRMDSKQKCRSLAHKYSNSN